MKQHGQEYEDDDDEEDGGQIDPNSTDSAVDATNQPYNREQEEQIRKERGYSPRDGATSKRVVEKFLVTPVMMNLLEILRNIYRDHPDECPIEVILLVFMYEYIEYGGIDPDKLNVDDIKKFIEYIRSRWAEVGSHVNREFAALSAFLFHFSPTRVLPAVQWEPSRQAERPTYSSRLRRKNALTIMALTQSTRRFGETTH